ncbi:MAG: helix-turn-helix transcriptional regulator [Flavobacteriaceae bacterium]|nr:helix-turn-helix transcriptional regulator [Flavobacteriaceae bacterium]
MENWETIVFTTSLLLLVISIGLSPILEEGNTTSTLTLICMVLVAITTVLETLRQQTHNIPSQYKKIHFVVGVFLIISVLIARFFDMMFFVQSIIVGFLVISIIVSMLIVRKTKSVKQFQHLEKSNRIFGIVFLIIVPIFLIHHYGFEQESYSFPTIFLLYFAFIALAARKIHDDLQRLSITSKQLDPNKQQFKNYGLTQREQEIATFLFDGLTYQEITNKLHISLPTVKTHASNIYKKCSVKNRNELSRLLMI